MSFIPLPTKALKPKNNSWPDAHIHLEYFFTFTPECRQTHLHLAVLFWLEFLLCLIRRNHDFNIYYVQGVINIVLKTLTNTTTNNNTALFHDFVVNKPSSYAGRSFFNNLTVKFHTYFPAFKLCRCIKKSWTLTHVTVAEHLCRSLLLYK